MFSLQIRRADLRSYLADTVEIESCNMNERADWEKFPMMSLLSTTATSCVWLPALARRALKCQILRQWASERSKYFNRISNSL